MKKPLIVLEPSVWKAIADELWAIAFTYLVYKVLTHRDSKTDKPNTQS